MSTSNGFNSAGENTFSGKDDSESGDNQVFKTENAGYGVSIEYTSVFLQKTPVTRGSGFDSSFANYWFEIQSKARTETGAASTVALGMFQVGSN